MYVKIGIFAVPAAADSASTMEQIIAADRCGLDVVGVQDHPNQWRFFDTWTLLAYAAGGPSECGWFPMCSTCPCGCPA